MNLYKKPKTQNAQLIYKESFEKENRPQPVLNAASYGALPLPAGAKKVGDK